MWQDKLKEIIYILENSNINEIEVTFWGRRFRAVKDVPVIIRNKDSDQVSSGKTMSDKPSDKENENGDEHTSSVSNEQNVLSPMPGIFYSSSSPDKPPFIRKGDQVNKGQVLCIIEAMKIMNEIESEMSGTVTEILINNADPVEYNQPLFVINQT
ncbi:MAG: acetyl-CoA carboxylase biotin carboxyl carrier protein [Candidatus Marinimicrobia bacterium]|nr:acetyl-CoA carboxylase biotin carboxyl carrier protein [Candidatus Neomarinimicrobiota bacterium]